jgi:hypothetical protein
MDAAPVVYITTNRFGDLVELDEDASAFLRISPARQQSSNLLHFFLDGRREVVTDRTALTCGSQSRDSTVR